MKRQASVGMFYLYTFLVVIAIAVLTSCGSNKHIQCDAYGINSVDNPENEEYVNEVAFNLNIEPEEVTQVMFDARYSAGY
jgi:hypothetical protein